MISQLQARLRELAEDRLLAGHFLIVLDGVAEALEGDSNDAEHDALVAVAQFFDIEYKPAES